MSQNKRQQRMEDKATRNALLSPDEAQTATQAPTKSRFHLPPYHVTPPQNGRKAAK